MQVDRCSLVAWASGLLLVAPSPAQTTIRASEAPSPVAVSNGFSNAASLSFDGSYVAFYSFASNLVAGDVNDEADIFVRDLETGTTVLASVASNGTQGDHSSVYARISGDGRIVVFESRSSSLVPGDSNGRLDVFVRNLESGVTWCVSVGLSGENGDDDSYSASISADGRFVCFESDATNLVAADQNGYRDVFVRDLATGVTTLASSTTAGGQTNYASYGSMISSDGNAVVFVSGATNLIPGDVNLVDDVFVRDLASGTTTLVSAGLSGAQADGASHNASLSADGRIVAFRSYASNLVPGDSNARDDMFVRDLLSGTTERVSVGSAGAQGNGYCYGAPWISADATLVAFASDSSNLTPGDANGFSDVFLRDLVSGTTSIVSVGPGGVAGDEMSYGPRMSGNGRSLVFISFATTLQAHDTNVEADVFVRDLRTGRLARASDGVQGFVQQGDADSTLPSISADGRCVAYTSIATNLVPGDTNGVADVLVRELARAATVRASVDVDGGEADGPSDRPSISSDGHAVAFESLASDLVPEDTNGWKDVFVRDLRIGATARVSVGAGGDQPNGGSGAPAISGDGSLVAFESFATNLVGGGTTGLQVFARNVSAGTTVLVSANADGVPGDGDSSQASISADGRYVAFTRRAANLGPGEPDEIDVYVRDLASGALQLASVSSAGAPGNGDSFHPSLSADGRCVAFTSRASNLVPGDTNGREDVFVRDLESGVTSRISLNAFGWQVSVDSSHPSISADGRFVAFESDPALDGQHPYAAVFVRDRLSATTERVSTSADLAYGLGEHASIAANGGRVAFESPDPFVDGDTGVARDVYVRDSGFDAAIVSSCAGGGSSAACPCGNDGEPRHGCDNSVGTGGALLSGTGGPCLSADTVSLVCAGEPASALSFVVQGNALIGPAQLGDGLRCAGGSLERLFVRSAVGGVVTVPGPGDPSISERSDALGDPIPLGGTRVYQVFYRDPDRSFCPPPNGGTLNASNAVAVVWGC